MKSSMVWFDVKPSATAKIAYLINKLNITRMDDPRIEALTVYFFGQGDSPCPLEMIDGGHHIKDLIERRNKLREIKARAGRETRPGSNLQWKAEFA